MRDIMFTSGGLGSTAHETLESAIEASMIFVDRDRAVLFWRFSDDGREAIAVRAREGAAHRASIPFDPFVWWEAIDPESQRTIVENRRRGLTVDLVAKLAGAPGGNLIGAFVKHGVSGEPYDEESARLVIDSDVMSAADALTEPTL